MSAVPTGLDIFPNYPQYVLVDSRNLPIYMLFGSTTSSVRTSSMDVPYGCIAGVVHGVEVPGDAPPAWTRVGLEVARAARTLDGGCRS